MIVRLYYSPQCRVAEVDTDENRVGQEFLSTTILAVGRNDLWIKKLWILLKPLLLLKRLRVKMPR